MTRGWCNRHYQRWYKYGNPLASSRKRTEDEVRSDIDSGSKCCVVCGVRKDFSAFARNQQASDGRQVRCRQCQRWRVRLLKYGVTPEQYDVMLVAQGGCCANAGCGATEPGGRGDWHTDHDHSCCPGSRSCGKCVRGLLCSSCNTALGLVRDDALVLQGLIEYLSRHRSLVACA